MSVFLHVKIIIMFNFDIISFNVKLTHTFCFKKIMTCVIEEQISRCHAEELK